MSIRDAIQVNKQPLGSAALEAASFWEWQPLDVACVPQPNAVAARLHVGGSDLGAPTTVFGDPTWRWRWMPRDAVGVFGARLVLTSADGSEHVEAFHIRIQPRTIDSQQYEALIEAVQRDAAALVYALHGGAEGARLSNERPRSLLEDYAVVMELGSAAATLVDAIAKQPYHALRSERTTVPLAAVDQADHATIAAIVHAAPDTMHIGPTAAIIPGPLPHSVAVERRDASTDVVEHRLLRGVLETLQWRAGLVRGALGQEQERRAQHDAVRGGVGTATAVGDDRVRQCAQLQRALRQALAAPFLADAKPLHTLAEPTQLMRRAPRYRRVYELYRALRHAPLIAWDSALLWLPIQSLPALYEQWCVLQVLKLVLELGGVVEQHVLTHDDTGDDRRRWTLRLRQNAPLLTIQNGAMQLRVVYQRRYGPQAATSTALGSLDPFVRIPDIAIEVQRGDQLTQVLLLDAKYRVDQNGGVPQDALDDAYAYRNAIGAGGQRRTLGAFLLYPGTAQIEGADNVGALPCLPINIDQLGMIKAILAD